MKSMIVFLGILIGFNAPSLANTCTAEDVQKRATEVALELQTFAQKDMNRFQEIANEMQQKALELQASGNLQELCDYYEDLLKEMRD